MMISLRESCESCEDSPTPETSSRWAKAKKWWQVLRIDQNRHSRQWCRWRKSDSSGLLRKIPVFILVVSLLEALVYYAADDSLRALLLYERENRKQLWRFLTYMLLHTDEVHLCLNVVVQGFVGTPLELEQGRLRCAVIYFGGGLAGSLGTSAFAAFSLMAGASGGVYALLTAQIPNVVLNYGTITYATHRIATVTILTAADVAYIFFHIHFYHNDRPKICWVAHASGAVAGVLLGFLAFRGTSKWKNKFRTASCAILPLPLIFIILLSFAPYSPNLSS